MAKSITPVTIYCPSHERAIALAGADSGGRYIGKAVGTLAFHLSIAEHGAGVFERLYVPMDLRGKFMEPAGGKVEFEN